MKKVFAVIGILVTFGAGFGTGLLATKKKYEKRSDKEIASVREAFKKHMDEVAKNVPPTRRGSSKKKKEELSNKGTSNSDFRSAPLPNDPIMDDYKDYAAPYSSKKTLNTKEHQKSLEPYVISPDEYMSSEYEAKSLVYYADGVLADDDDNMIPNPETLLGKKALHSFGQYEDDSVYVRDDNLKIDYEILLSQKSFKKSSDGIVYPDSPKQSLQSDEDDE